MSNQVPKLSNEFFQNQKRAFFLYQLNYLDLNIQTLKNIFPELKQIFYSVKANPNTQIIKYLANLGIGFDVSSFEELRLIKKLNIPMERVTFSGPAKTDQVLNELKKIKIKAIHIDSIEEYHILKQSATNLTLRLPLEEVFSQKVGLPIKDLESILSATQGQILGFHLYLGRERASEDLTQKYLMQIKNLFKKFHQAFVSEPELFWGGGFPLPNFLEAKMFPGTSEFKLNIEAGRTLVHNCGWYGARVLSIKNREKSILIIDGGLQHLATHFSSPRFNQLGVQAQYWQGNGESFANDSEMIVDVYGSLGVWHDLLIKDLAVPTTIKRNDWILISPAGAYGITAATNQFIGPEFPDEFVLNQGKWQKACPDKFISYLESGKNEYQKT